MLEPKPEEFEDYLGGPHDLIVLTKYHVQVARMEPNGVVRHYTYYCATLMIVKLLLIFVMYYSNYCETDVNFLFLIFVVA